MYATLFVDQTSGWYNERPGVPLTLLHATLFVDVMSGWLVERPGVPLK